MIIQMNENVSMLERDILLRDISNVAECKNNFRENKIIVLQKSNDTIMNLVKNSPAVKEISEFKSNYRMTSREFKNEDTIIDINGIKIGGGNVAVMAGPCSIESRTQILEIAEAVKNGGASILRGGAFKPRTSPYSFQGLGEDGLKFMQEAGKKFGLATVTEIMDIESFDLVEEYVDILQIGARNMSNFSLLKRAGKSNKPILLKRGMSSTIEEFLLSAEYILNGGNENVILCERGIRTFETMTRNTLDLSVVPLIKEISHLPIIVDPSHGTGKRSLVGPMSKAAIMIGADGLMIEVHNHPEQALSDGKQSLLPAEFDSLMTSLEKIREVEGV